MDNVIYQRRRALNLTQSQLAERVGVSLRSIQNWEKGVVNIPPGMRLLLERELGVKICDSEAPSDMIADGDNNTQVRGDGNKVTTHSASSLDKALDEIGEMRKALTEAMRANQEALRVNQENTSRLLGILENMSGKQESDR